jgi:photosystem II stability/assembly factor-like uncharacterized protein
MSGFGDTQAFHVLSISFHPVNSNTIYVGVVDIAVTDDNGITWKKGQHTSDIEVGHADITQIYFSPHTGNDVMWICNDGGIYRHILDFGTQSFNGSGSTGLNISQVQKMAADRQMIVAGLLDNGVLRSVNDGQQWDLISSGDGGVVVITDAEANNFWFGAGVPWRMWRSYFGNPTESVLHPGDNSCPLFYDPYDDRIYSATLQKIVSRAQSGSTINPWEDEKTNLQVDPYKIWSIEGSALDGKTIFVIYREANERDLTIVRKAGNDWISYHRENVAPANSRILHVVASDQWSNEFWVLLESPVGMQKILHTVDDGENWIDVSGNLANFKLVHSMVVTPFNPMIMYAATDIGVFRTTNGGDQWEPFMEGLPVVRCSVLRFVADDSHSGNHKLIVATFGRGMFDRLIHSPPIIYVDQSNTDDEDGSFEHPYRTVEAAITAAPAGSIVAIRGATYKEPQIINKNVTLVTIFQPTIIK